MTGRSPLPLDGRLLLDADRLISSGIGERRASFEVSLRRLPAHWGYVVVAGVELLLERLGSPACSAVDADRLKRALGLSNALVDRLVGGPLKVDIDVAPEGTVAFAREPIATVEGALADTAIVGAWIQSAISAATIVATRVARLRTVSGVDAILDASSTLEPAIDASIGLARAAFVGGATATTNASASLALDLPMRATPMLTERLFPAKTRDTSWDEAPSDRVIDLGSDDDEAWLVELHRTGQRAGGYFARGLLAPLPLALTCSLVAIEDQGAWSPRAGLTDDAPDVSPGRKRVTRYFDANGRIVLDLVHLASERTPAPKRLGAATSHPLTRSITREGLPLERPEPATTGRERSIAAQSTLPPGVARLRSPDAAAIDISDAARAGRALVR